MGSMGMAALPEYEVYAIKFGQVARLRPENYLRGDIHDATPDPLDYFLWVVRGAGRTVVVDTGFGEAEAKRRGRQRTMEPMDALKLVGVDAATAADVVITHLHYDHAGCLDLFPAARFHVQDDEMRYATGRHMCHACIRQAYSVEDVVGLVRAVYAGRVQFHDGAAELAPGLSLHRIGGHTMGMQSVRVNTKRGWVVLASDASHMYGNMETGVPFPIVHDMTETLEGYATLRRLADGPDHIVPGHDPRVLQRYPAAAAGLAGVVARLDLAPRPA